MYVSEGKARLMFSSDDVREQRVFYNPRMSMNRDIAILFVQSYFNSRKIRICDPMTGSGVRAMRYLFECQNVEAVEASDMNSEAVEFARRMFQLNHVVGERVIVTEDDANKFLLNHEDRFDLVDLDPFGAPVSFYESALRSIVDGGVLAATATDMAPLTGARAAACFRKYNIVPVRTDFEKEIAIRVLAASLALAANRLEMGTRLVFSHASDHYARVYVEVRKGKRAANESAKQLGFVEYCPRCLRRDSCRKYEEFHLSCENCRGLARIGGLLWLGTLWDVNCVNNMNDYSGLIASARIGDLQKLVGQIDEEAMAPPFYYRVDLVASSLRINSPRIGLIVKALRDMGYVATRTHFHPNAFRTDAPIIRIRSELSRLANESKSKKV
ncbi:MAG TPA: tRNA (guanine(10)-N(2))-dimethyltransferase [Candidatus Bathyarchaeia archaeon]|nr:tRNA (guanine(10)-N(2))-dimethyltransferase [Candidatus Bathyarchaeia archaeon]